MFVMKIIRSWVLFRLAVLALILPWPWKIRIIFVNGTCFIYNGFQNSSVYVVPPSPWAVNPANGSIYLDISNLNNLEVSTPGRFLFPLQVQMKDPVTKAVNNFSTTFIYQMLHSDTFILGTGDGLAFVMVPDNITVGAGGGYMGILTANTTTVAKNYMHDNHTFAVEFDTFDNPEFNDLNNNHVGVDLASMNSSFATKPTLTLTEILPNVLYQVWIEYNASDSQINVYMTQYKQSKPDQPVLSTTVPNLQTVLNDYMYVGFTAASGLESTDLDSIWAWSFSTDGPAPSISIAADAPPTAPPPGSSPSPSPTAAPPIASPSQCPSSAEPPGFTSPPPGLGPSQPPKLTDGHIVFSIPEFVGIVIGAMIFGFLVSCLCLLCSRQLNLRPADDHGLFGFLS